MLNCVNLVGLFSTVSTFSPKIISAINSTEDKKMMLKDIYNWIQTNVPEFGEGIVLTSLTLSWIPYLHGFRKFWNFMWCMIKNISKDYSGGPTQASWKNSVRHNLSLHKSSFSFFLFWVKGVFFSIKFVWNWLKAIYSSTK